MEIELLLGKVIVKIEQLQNSDGNEELVFTCSDGKKYGMSHIQECFESVGIDEIYGDLNNLLNSPILHAEESSNEGFEIEGLCFSYTWTFYKLATINGWVDIKWYGTSNGYYSESVDFYEIANQHRTQENT